MRDELRSDAPLGRLYGDTAQAFAVLLLVKSVGVMGDARTYEDLVALRAVTTGDFMMVDWARLFYDFTCLYCQPHYQRSEQLLPRGVRYQQQAAEKD